MRPLWERHTRQLHRSCLSSFWWHFLLDVIASHSVCRSALTFSRGWCPTDCSLTSPRLSCSGVHLLDISIRSRLVLFMLVTHLCCRYEQLTWGSTLTQMSPSLRQIRSVRRSLTCTTLLTLVHALVVTGGLLQLSSLGYFRTTEKWSYVLRLPCGEHETSGGVEDRLQHSTSVWTTLAESFRENSVPVMCSRESLHNQHGAVIPCWDPPLDCRRSSRRRLRSASMLRLVIPSTQCTTLNDQAFPVTAARVWNALPSSVRSAPLLLQFLCNLKTALSVIILFTIVSSCVTDCNF